MVENITLPESLTGIFKLKQRSYKMVLILSLLENMDDKTGRSLKENVILDFLTFYQLREERGLPVEKAPRKIGSWKNMTHTQVWELLDTPLKALTSVLEVTSQSRFISKSEMIAIFGDQDPYVSDTSYLREFVGFKQNVWGEMNEEDIVKLRFYALHEVDVFYENFEQGNEYSFRDNFLHLMGAYPTAKQEPFKSHSLGELVRTRITNNLFELPFLSEAYTIKGSVGQGKWVGYPWIAIMDNRITTSTKKGFYVCYVFEEDMSALYLTLKYSDQPIVEAKGQGRKVQVQSLMQRVQEIRSKIPKGNFIKQDIVDAIEAGVADYRMGAIVYKVYDKDNFPSDSALINDLEEFVRLYKNYVEDVLGYSPLDSIHMRKNTRISDQMVLSVTEEIKQYIAARGFSYPDHLIENIYLSIKSKPFLILAGISGTGKTKLVKLFAEAIGATSDNGQFELIPVRPDWNDPSDLIGYRDLSGQFVEGRLTEVLRRASELRNRSKPFFVCLDEMNLARVEHYFSDFLSLMETQEWIDDPESGEKQIVTGPVVTIVCEKGSTSICIPENVYIIGTVNMDETTHPFSKKVLDRANTIEFNFIDFNDLDYLIDFDEESVESAQVHQTFLRSEYLNIKDAKEYVSYLKGKVDQLAKVNKILEQIHAHVGYRIRDSICFFLIYNMRFGLLEEADAFDIQLCQKILPRIQGSSISVRNTLLELLNFTSFRNNAYQADQLLDINSELYNVVFGTDESRFDNCLYKRSTEKIAFMLRRLEEDGFTSFWLS